MTNEAECRRAATSTGQNIPSNFLYPDPPSNARPAGCFHSANGANDAHFNNVVTGGTHRSTGPICKITGKVHSTLSPNRTQFGALCPPCARATAGMPMSHGRGVASHGRGGGVTTWVNARKACELEQGDHAVSTRPRAQKILAFMRFIRGRVCTAIPGGGSRLRRGPPNHASDLPVIRLLLCHG